MVDAPWAKQIKENPYYNRMRGIEDGAGKRGVSNLRVIEGGKPGTTTAEIRPGAAPGAIDSPEHAVRPEALLRLGHLGDAPVGIKPNPYFNRMAGREEISGGNRQPGAERTTRAESSHAAGKGADGNAPVKPSYGELMARAESLQARIAELEAAAAQTGNGDATVAPLIAVLDLPGVKTWLLSRFNPAKHPDATELERRLLARNQQKISAAYEIVERHK
jgi:hypothetical protein